MGIRIVPVLKKFARIRSSNLWLLLIHRERLNATRESTYRPSRKSFSCPRHRSRPWQHQPKAPSRMRNLTHKSGQTSSFCRLYPGQMSLCSGMLERMSVLCALKMEKFSYSRWAKRLRLFCKIRSRNMLKVSSLSQWGRLALSKIRQCF